jgi:hypothetical protein
LFYGIYFYQIVHRISRERARAFGKKEAYANAVMKANLERLARLIKVCGFLMQTKVYLFWENLNV